MIRQEGDVLVLEGPVTLETVPHLARAAAQPLAGGVRAVDFGAVTEVDSAAVALALEWLKTASAAGRALALRNLPSAMRNLASLYGVSELLQTAR